ncbi:MAG: oligopeptidase [Gammaproteobacteria bacterium]|jgi:oligopeptidase A|nr:oligopeptidase [Gammaproteobacteria bacterium]
MDTPLLSSFVLPPFSAIKPEQVEPAIDTLLQECRRTIEKTLAQKAPWTWEKLVQPIETQDEKLSKVWSPVSHLNSVKNSPQLREAYEHCIAKLSEYHTDVGQNLALFKAYEELSQSPEYQKLDSVQKRIIDHTLRDFKLSGVSLADDKKQRYKEIQQRLSQLCTQFENHIMDATDSWSYHTEDESLLKGLPEHSIAAAKEKAEKASKAGWMLGIDFPTYYAVITYADDRHLRKIFYTAYATRASDQDPNAGKWDNSKIMQEILALRHEEAELLGFSNFAEVSLYTKMAKDPKKVLGFLEDLAKRSKPMAQKELQALQSFAESQGLKGSLQSWDIAYYSEKLRQAEFGLSEESLRPYFPATQALKGLFEIVEKIYGLTVKERKVDTWHESVQFFDLYDNKQLRGSFYVDLYARPNKRGGAWMDDYITRRRLEDGSIQSPVAYLTCNFTPPLKDKPACLTHDEVTTLFHEFGHVMHHLMSKVDYLAASGIHGVEWDAVELPSQFMENFCWCEEVMPLISSHIETQEPLPKAMFEQLLKTRSFQAGLMMLRQLEFSLFDFRMHYLYDPKHPQDIQAVLDQVRKEIAVLKPPAFNRFQHSFSHIFAGGYAAGYYSYKWAEVLSADAFSKFEEEGVLNPNTGKAFLNCILEQGSTKDAMDLFIDFRGREPKIDALLQHNGII